MCVSVSDGTADTCQLVHAFALSQLRLSLSLRLSIIPNNSFASVQSCELAPLFTVPLLRRLREEREREREREREGERERERERERGRGGLFISLFFLTWYKAVVVENAWGWFC